MQNTTTEARDFTPVVEMPKANDPQFSTALRVAAIADDYVIDCADMYQLAADELKAFKCQTELLEARRRTITDPLNQALKAANALFGPYLEKLDAASKLLRARMVEFSKKEQARIAAENAERERLMREERERLAAAAAVAAQEGRQEEAYALQQTAALVTAPARSTAPLKVVGASVRTNWSAECLDLGALIQYVAQHPECTNLLQANQQALTAMAKAQKENMKVPGVKAWDKGGMAIRT